MSLAVRLNSQNTVVECIEIPDEEDNNACNFINFVLKLKGTWISASNFQKLTGLNPTVGCIYIPQKEKFIYQKPFDNWILDENDVWIPPVKNNLRNMNFGYENEVSEGPQFIWDQERCKWGHIGIPPWILDEGNRDSGFYFISKAMPNAGFVDASDYVDGLNVPCKGKSYTYVDAHPDWEPGFIYPIYKEEYGKKYGISEENPDRYYSHKNYVVVFDGAPYYFIQHVNLCDLNQKIDPSKSHHEVHNMYEISKELENEHISQIPFISGRTMGELLRLIIDWDYEYHINKNNSNTSVICHQILGTMNIPDEIYDEILKTTEPSILRKYLDGDSAYSNIGKRQKTSQLVLDWAAEKYWDMRYLKVHTETNVSEINDNHYINFV